MANDFFQEIDGCVREMAKTVYNFCHWAEIKGKKKCDRNSVVFFSDKKALYTVQMSKFNHNAHDKQWKVKHT